MFFYLFFSDIKHTVLLIQKITKNECWASSLTAQHTDTQINVLCYSLDIIFYCWRMNDICLATVLIKLLYPLIVKTFECVK